MGDTKQCEYCGRPIKSEPVNKVLRGKEHTYCSGFCFRLYFYDVPTISYADLQKMYSVGCINVPGPDFLRRIEEEV